MTATHSTQAKNIEKYPPKRKVFMEFETASRALVLAEGFPLVYKVARGSHPRFRGWSCKCTRSGYLKLWPTRFSCKQYGNRPLDMQGLWQPLVLLAQPVQWYIGHARSFKALGALSTTCPSDIHVHNRFRGWGSK